MLPECLPEKKFMKEALEEYIGQKIKSARLLYRFDPLNKTNLHKYIDGHPHLLAVACLANGRLTAAYSQDALSPDSKATGGGLLLSPTEKRAFRLSPGKRSVTYDPYFVIFGNSEFRLKSGELRFFTNLGVQAGFFMSEGCKHEILTGDAPKDTEVTAFEFFRLIF